MFKYEYTAFKQRRIDAFFDYTGQKFVNILSFIASRPLYFQVLKIRLKKLYRKFRYFFFRNGVKREIRRFFFKCQIVFFHVEKLCGIVRLRIIFAFYCSKWKLQWFYCWIYLKFSTIYLFFYWLVANIQHYAYSFWIEFSFWFKQLWILFFWPISFSYRHLVRIFKSWKKVVIDHDLDMEYTKPKHKKKLTPVELKKFKEHLNLDQKKAMKK